MKCKHILVATDFQCMVLMLIKRALEMAKLMGADLHLLHVVEPLPGYGYAFIGSAEIEVELVNESKKQLAKLGQKHAIAEKIFMLKLGR